MSRCTPYSFSEFKKQKELRILSSIKLLKEKHSDNSLEAKEKKQEEKKQKEKKQKEKKKSKSHEKKKDRREKKAKKDITKNETLTDEKKNGSRKRTVAERSNLDSKCDFYPKTKEGEIEQLERSSLTEELCLPSQYICDSPDSCQNSHKRTKLNTIDVPKITFGNGLLIRLQLSKRSENLLKQPSVEVLQQREPAEKLVLANPPCLALTTQKQSEQASLVEQPCLPTLNQSEIKQVGIVGSSLPFVKTNEAGPSIKSEQPSFSGRLESTQSLRQEKPNTTVDDLNSFKGQQLSSKSRKKQAKYRDLIINWQPHPLQVDELGEVDQNWLFGGGVQQKQQDVSKEITKADEKILVPSWPPRTHILNPDLFALPFVLPF